MLMLERYDIIHRWLPMGMLANGSNVSASDTVSTRIMINKLYTGAISLG